MDIKTIHTFGDGFASSHLWPEWPVILEALLPDYKFTHHGAVGAGNEFIANAVIQTHQTDPQSYFLVQWAQINRFDKLIQDSTWDNIIHTDPVYHFNRVKLNDQQWWISSASQQEDVVKYHTHYIQSKQGKLRTLNYIYLVSALLGNNALFFSTENLNITQHDQKYLKNSHWVDQNMWDYSAAQRFAQVRQQQVQPSPVVHMAYVAEHLLPNLPFVVDSNRLAELQRRINQHNWVAYDPDRVEIWQTMVAV